MDGAAGSQNYIHMVRLQSQRKNAPKLVVIHGYGGGTAVFMRLAPLLQQYFEVILFDLLGMGASGRPLYDSWTAEEATAYFVDSMLAFVQKLNLVHEQFYLLGHSLGGYIAAEYAIKYPKHIKHLILMSPVGMP